MKKIEHIGIAVKDMNAAIKTYELLLDTKCYKQEKVESEHVLTAFFRAGPNKIELLSALDGQGPIQKFIDKKGEGIHHIAFDVSDIYKEKARLEKADFICLNEKPKEGADGKLVCFFHPKTAHGVLIELCMDKANLSE